MEMDDAVLKDQLAQRFRELPKVVQDAILSADVETHMRDLAEQHKLHFDQWTSLENEVMFALLGMEPVSELTKNIQKQVGVPADVASALAADISRIVFLPIRTELDAALRRQEAARAASSQPAPSAAVSPQKTASTGEQPARVAVVAGTPPPPPPSEKAIRPPASGAYASGGASHQRSTVLGDPYREIAGSS